MGIGKKIRESRKNRHCTAVELGKMIGVSRSAMSIIENDELKNGPQPEVLVKIADALNDLSILTHHCQSCPIRKQVILKQFPDLNNIRRDPAVIAARLRKEMVEGAEALDILTERFSDQDFKSRPDYKEVFEREMEQVIDVKRGIEILEFELIMASVHSSKDLKDVYDRQQTKCEKRGHHNAELVA